MMKGKGGAKPGDKGRKGGVGRGEGGRWGMFRGRPEHKAESPNSELSELRVLEFTEFGIGGSSDIFPSSVKAFNGSF